MTINTVSDFKNYACDLIDNKKTRSAWGRGVNEYAIEFINELTDRDNILDKLSADKKIIASDFLNGANGWTQYSYGGCALICDCDIAERLCNPSELKKTKGGERNPNSRETWLDVQARALYQAARIAANALNQTNIDFYKQNQDNNKYIAEYLKKIIAETEEK